MDYKELDVWKKSIEFVESIYKATAKFPDEERFGLTNQLRRAAISIPSNIAEGSARQSDKEFIRFLFIAYGSSAEIETQLIIAKNLGFHRKHRYISIWLIINQEANQRNNQLS